VAQNVIIEHLGSMQVNAGVSITTSSIISQFPTATALIINTEGVSVSIDATLMFLTEKYRESYLATGKTYLFNKDCQLVIGKYRTI
jgi:hypothetical protein